MLFWGLERDPDLESYPYGFSMSLELGGSGSQVRVPIKMCHLAFWGPGSRMAREVEGSRDPSIFSKP